MRNLFNLFAIAACVFTISCSKYDDSAIWEELGKHEDRILRLETLCNQMNTNITSLQTIIIALQNNDYVTNIAPIKEGDHEIGYTITFSKSGSITIYHGKDGENGKDGVNGADGKDGLDGQDGVNGKDGKDGYTPKIGVKQHIDGKYYWTLDGNFLLDDNGNMIPTTGDDGANGSDGKDGEDGVNGIDGITPKLKIEDGYWCLSYDNGESWQKLGKATGENGKDGVDGDNFIESVTQDDDNVYFTLSEGQILTIKKNSEKIILFSDANVKIICLEHWDTNGDCEISHDEASAVTSIDGVFSNNKKIIIFNELKYFTGLTTISSKAFEGCTQLVFLTLPSGIKSIEQSAFKDCTNLKRIEIPFSVEVIGSESFRNCTNLKSVTFQLGSQLSSLGSNVFNKSESLEEIEIPNKVSMICGGTFSGCKNLKKVTFQSNSSCSLLDSDDGYNGAFEECTSLKEIILPASLIEIKKRSFGNCTSLEKVSFEKGSRLMAICGGGGSSYDYRGAFYGCTRLYEFDASNCTNLSSIKDYVFTKKSTDNQSLTIEIFRIGTVTPPASSGGARIINLYVPSGCKGIYKNWGGATTIYEM